MTRDEEMYPDSEEFDALRFYKLQQQCDNSSQSGAMRYQYVNVSPTDLTWNYGRHACPGRYFATNLEKIIIATILLKYDICNAEGVKGQAMTFRNAGVVSVDPF